MTPTINDVKQYWESHPLLSYEVSSENHQKFFSYLDHIKVHDTERFAFSYWEFDNFPGKTILDIGCGPGWLTVNYAKGKANVYSVDLTKAAVELTKKSLNLFDLKVDVREANAEKLPFENDFFDFICSSGVLHHTPDTLQAFREAYRVLKPGGRAKITLYRKGILHSNIIFPITRMIMKIVKLKHPGADMASTSHSVDDFIRQYDGSQNPVGIGKTNKDWKHDLESVGFKITGMCNHFFPNRFLPFGKHMPRFIHHFLDKYFGTMVYFDLKKD